jgi:hypothetical protein
VLIVQSNRKRDVRFEALRKGLPVALTGSPIFKRFKCEFLSPESGFNPSLSDVQPDIRLAAAVAADGMTFGFPFTFSHDTRRSGEIEAVKVHDLVPRRDKVMDKLLLGVLTSVDFGQGAEFGVRTEDEVDTRAGPLEFAALRDHAFEQVFVFRARLPLRAHVEQIHKEVIGERLGPLGEDAVLGLSRSWHSRRAFRQREPSSQAAVSVSSCARSTSSSSADTAVFGLLVVAETVCFRFEHGEGLHIGLLLRGIRASRREGNRHIVTGIFRRLLDTCATGQDDQVSQRDLLAADWAC